MRVKRGTTTKRRHNKVLRQAKGYRWGRSKLFRLAKNAVSKALQHAYVGRRQKKRDFRKLWIIRISAATRTLGTNFSKFQAGLTKNNIKLNRKVLADIAARNPEVFEKIVKEVS
ncbi:MAG: 50S ribosomal protein L20 [Candidatus Gracilibacteria bacterium]|jgi:large subunit ribosomal protein L20|nr:50S ribosomal protein L20 [Candidatus Gracilibacteria bacterium]